VTRYSPLPLVFARLSPEQALDRSREFLADMSRRRSIRQFSADPVAPELIENAIRVAGTAPSGANQQPWTFVVISDPAVKARIRAAAEHEEELLYTKRASEEYLHALEPIGTDWSKPHITDAPFLIAVFEQAHGDGKKHYYVRESVGIAIGLLLVALHRSGLATLAHAPSPMGFLKEILDRPDNERAVLLIPVGYPSPSAEVPLLEKKSLEEIATFI
jgi:iodotyrosine deiodinase